MARLRKPIRSSLALALLALLLLAACSGPSTRTPGPEGASASPAGPTGTLEGTITDSDGSAIGGARVTVRNDLFGRKWKAQADMDGDFLLLDLPAADGYRVTVSTPPFWTTTLKDISVTAGKTTRLTVVRRLGHRGGPLNPGETGY